MRYGLVYFKETDNIGDDIQSYAVMQFLPQIDYLIDREQMNEFISGVNEPVAVVLSGWFLHKKFNWPPSKDIYPCCTSLHFSVNDYMGIGYGFLDDLGGEYLKNYGPIGCRDTSTLEILQEKGIPSYLSGCATLTLPIREKKENGNYICLVDVPDEVMTKVSTEIEGTGIEIKRLTHSVDYAKNPIEWADRVSKVEQLLDIYQNAKFVITKRLHCALPCLSFKTPVLLLLDIEKDDVSRYSHFVELLNVTSTAEFLNGKATFDLNSPPENKKQYILESKKLSEAIRKFIHQVQNNEIRDSFQKWKSVDNNRLNKWHTKMLTQAALCASNQVDLLLCEKNMLEADTYKRITEISEQYDQDTTTLKHYLTKQEAETIRLNNVIIAKTADANRLDNVVMTKNQEISRINQILQDKDQEILRINQILQEKDQEILRINQILQEKDQEILRINQILQEKDQEILRINQISQEKEENIEGLNRELEQNKKEIEYWRHVFEQIEAFIQYKEESSISWMLFHSKKYKSLKISDKLAFLKKIVGKSIKEESYCLEDISEDVKKHIL